MTVKNNAGLADYYRLFEIDGFLFLKIEGLYEMKLNEYRRASALKNELLNCNTNILKSKLKTYINKAKTKILGKITCQWLIRL